MKVHLPETGDINPKFCRCCEQAEAANARDTHLTMDVTLESYILKRCRSDR